MVAHTSLWPVLVVVHTGARVLKEAATPSDALRSFSVVVGGWTAAAFTVPPRAGCWPFCGSAQAADPVVVSTSRTDCVVQEYCCDAGS